MSTIELYLLVVESSKCYAVYNFRELLKNAVSRILIIFLIRDVEKAKMERNSMMITVGRQDDDDDSHSSIDRSIVEAAR